MGKDYIFRQLASHILSIVLVVTDENSDNVEISEILEDAANVFMDLSDQISKDGLFKVDRFRN